MIKEREEELKLIKAIKNGDKASWEHFVSNYSDVIFNSIRHWCQPYCRKSHQIYLCPWNLNSKTIASKKETCGDVIDMYIFSLDALRKRITRFRGESRLSTFIVASLRYVKLDYFRNKYGRLQLPLVIKKTPKIMHEVYKLLCKGKDKDYIAAMLDISADEVKDLEFKIRKKLREKGQEWQHLDGWIALKREPTPLVNENGDDIIDQTPIHLDITPEEREVASYMIDAMKDLSPVKKRLLQLRFQQKLSVSEISSMTEELKFLKLKNQKQIYKEIDDALTCIGKFIKSRYDLEENVSNDVKKCIKNLLENLMLSNKEVKD